MTDQQQRLQASASVEQRGTRDVIRIDVGDGREILVEIDQRNGKTISINGREVFGHALWFSDDRKQQQWGRS